MEAEACFFESRKARIENVRSGLSRGTRTKYVL